MGPSSFGPWVHVTIFAGLAFGVATPELSTSSSTSRTAAFCPNASYALDGQPSSWRMRGSPATEEATAVFWAINSAPAAQYIVLLKTSLWSIIRNRGPNESISLIVVVVEEGGRAIPRSSPPPDWCASLAEGSSWPCQEHVASTIAGSCAVPRPVLPQNTIVVVRTTGEWARHPELMALSRLSAAFVNETISHNPREAAFGRRDLVRFAAQNWFRVVAHGVLLPLGVRRAIYLDLDTVAQTSLRELFETPLGGSRFCAFALRCLDDPYHSMDYIHTHIGVVKKYGFKDRDAQSINNGVLLMDLAQVCAQRGVESVLEVASAAVRRAHHRHHRERLFANSRLILTQPTMAIAWARNAVYVDPRWNCRRVSRRKSADCWVVHSKKHVLTLAARNQARALFAAR